MRGADEQPGAMFSYSRGSFARSGTPQPLIGQEIRWVAGDGLLELEFPPADAELIELLRKMK